MRHGEPLDHPTSSIDDCDHVIVLRPIDPGHPLAGSSGSSQSVGEQEVIDNGSPRAYVVSGSRRARQVAGRDPRSLTDGAPRAQPS